MFGIYVHIPFCLKKCDYCDFFSVPCARKSVPEGEYLDALTRQLASEADALGLGGREVSSVYFGGGTPSLMSPDFFSSVIEGVRDRFSVAKDGEISCEVNPKTAGASWFDGASRAGITRISIGVQSFNDGLLRELGRVHKAEDAMRAIAEAQDAGFESVGVDLMFGIPGETTGVLEDDVRTAMTFQPQHISAYQLTLEEGTPLAKKYGGTHPVSDDELLEQMRIVARMIERGGWRRYEISNFAKPGSQCRHNLNYWRYGEYLGLGAGATSFIAERRWTQVKDVTRYIERTGELAESEEIDVHTAMAEYCFLGLRATDGIDAGDFERRFGRGFDDVYGDSVRKLEREGFVIRSEGRIMLSPRGVELSNQVFERFLP